MAKVIRLANYKGIPVEGLSFALEEGELEQILTSWQQNAAKKQQVMRAAKEGDTVIIDFKGSVDGEYFEGGTADNYELKLGSGVFIPGFEVQLIGAAAGDRVDVDVTFPEQYGASALAGKRALFEVEVKEVQEEVIPELDDSFAAQVSPYQSLEEMKTKLREQMLDHKEKEAKRARFVSVLEKIAADSEVELEEEEVNAMVDGRLNEMAQQLMQQGLTLPQYLEFSGQKEEDMRAQLSDVAKRDALYNAILREVALREELTVAEAELDQQLANMAIQYQTPAAQIREQLGEGGLQSLRDNLLLQRAQDLIMESMVES